MAREAHKLRGNKGVKYPRHLFFFDVESTLQDEDEKIIHHPYLLVGNYYRTDGRADIWRDFTTPEEFWEWVSETAPKKHKTIVFSYNVTYDLVASRGFKTLKRLGWSISQFYEKGRAFILTFKLYGPGEDKPVLKTLLILNAGNYYQGTLAALGKAFDLPKLDYDVFNPDPTAALPYCRRDVEIVRKAVLTFIDFCQENDLGNFAVTTPAQAFTAYRHRFMPHDIFIHDHEPTIALEREAYYGGRTECWRIGKYTGKYFYLDVNSMYPFVMRAYPYPTRLLSYRENVPLSSLPEALKENYLLVARCEVETDTPYFPVRVNNKGKIYFPVGRFVTALCTPEIQTALDNKLLRRVDALALYQGADIFTPFVDFFYNERLKAKVAGNKTNDILYKLMLNSLYGKFGQKAGGWTLLGDTDLEGSGHQQTYDLDAKREINYRWIDGVMFKEEEEGEGANSFVAVAAHVTAHARMLLFNYALLAGLEHVFYMDTDSLFLDATGYEKLVGLGMVNPHELGALKVEAETDSLEIFTPKDYIFGDKIRRKGITKNAVQIRPDRFEVLYWPKISTLIREDSLNQYFNIRREKTLKRIYDKGQVRWDGTVQPFNAQELENRQIEADWAREFTKQQAADLRQIRKEILARGGVKDQDYGHLVPKYLRRKTGQGLDVMVQDLARIGYHFQDADDLLFTLTNGQEGRRAV